MPMKPEHLELCKDDDWYKAMLKAEIKSRIKLSIDFKVGLGLLIAGIGFFIMVVI